jgi:hypothetical protein
MELPRTLHPTSGQRLLHTDKDLPRFSSIYIRTGVHGVSADSVSKAISMALPDACVWCCSCKDSSMIMLLKGIIKQRQGRMHINCKAQLVPIMHAPNAIDTNPIGRCVIIASGMHQTLRRHSQAIWLVSYKIVKVPQMLSEGLSLQKMGPRRWFRGVGHTVHLRYSDRVIFRILPVDNCSVMTKRKIAYFVPATYQCMVLLGYS